MAKNSISKKFSDLLALCNTKCYTFTVNKLINNSVNGKIKIQNLAN